MRVQTGISAPFSGLAIVPPRKPVDVDALESSVPYMLGQIQGQLRELIHSSNNNGQKLEALSSRVAALEAANDRRDGAAGVFQMIFKSPAIGWLAGAAISAWAMLTGKVHI